MSEQVLTLGELKKMSYWELHEYFKRKVKNVKDQWRVDQDDYAYVERMVVLQRQMENLRLRE